jgi:hypothetical protein
MNVQSLFAIATRAGLRTVVPLPFLTVLAANKQIEVLNTSSRLIAFAPSLDMRYRNTHTEKAAFWPLFSFWQAHISRFDKFWPKSPVS